MCLSQFCFPKKKAESDEDTDIDLHRVKPLYIVMPNCSNLDIFDIIL